MNILIDAFILAIFVFTCIAGYKNGFVKTVLAFLKNIIALILSVLFSSSVGLFLYDKVFKSVFEKMTLDRFADWLGVEGGNLDIGPLLNAEHSEFLKYVENLGINIDTLAEKYHEYGDKTGELMAEYIAQPIGMTVSKVVAFILIFIVSVIVINIVGFIIGKIVKLPILNATNKFLGLVLGVVLGVIFVFVFVSILDLILPYIKLGGESLGSGDFKNETFLYGYLSDNSVRGLLEDLIMKR